MRIRVRRGASPEEYVRAYQTYQRCYGDSLGEFLAHFHILWWDAALHGSVTGYDDIVRLLSLLPDEWREWSTMVDEEYIVTAYPAYDLVGDFPRFLAAMFTRYVCYGSAPPLLIDSPVPEVQDSPAPVAPGYPSQWESEAGPSRPPVGSRNPTLPMAPPACPLSARDPTLLTEAEREALGAARKGKTPMTDSEEDKEEDLPVATPVGSSRLQAITVLSSYSHFHSAAEAAPPVLTKESMEDPHLIWNWVCGEDENNPILVNSDEERGPKR
ncbi:hypothetical protein SASPL_105166 [Salvia splendens]|uniref:Uncharacterized protein n=1 Tax=Salvia splendens TaxID=180675 RepID=A0A8X8YN30_SALSN|nr:hypothetical protein SASPL_105166 [Salvia splendens]